TSIVLIKLTSALRAAVQFALSLSKLHGPRRGLRRVQPVFLHRLADLRRGYRTFVRQRLQRGDYHVISVDLEKAPQFFARVRAPEAVGAEDDVTPRHVGANLFGERADV